MARVCVCVCVCVCVFLCVCVCSRVPRCVSCAGSLFVGMLRVRVHWFGSLLCT